jgi:dTDP-4-dehydrorhamnose reductase
MNEMRIVVTGHKGQLGRALQETLQKHDLLGIDLPEHDITDAKDISETICDFDPEVVIHAAAWTDVDGCAEQPELALRINGLGTHNVALACLRCGAVPLTISTNEVFDGQKGAAYYEHERCNPGNAYARSKWAAEVYTRMHLSRFYIVRTAWLYGRGGNNFPAKIVSAAKKHNQLRVVCDEISSPTYAPDLAQGIAKLIQTGQYGIYHLTNEGVCSRYDFACRILALAGMADVPVEPITSDQWPRASTPPLHCVIRNLAGVALGIQLRHWDLALREYFGAT